MGAEPLDAALGEVRRLVLAPDRLIRAIAAGRRRGQELSTVRAELRPVTLKAGSALQIVTTDGTRPVTRNAAWGAEADAAVDALLAEPFGNWHVETVDATVQLRVTKKGAAQVHRSAPQGPRRQIVQALVASTAPQGPRRQIVQALVASTAPKGPRRQIVQASAAGTAPVAGRSLAHDREKAYRLDPGDPLFDVIGGNAAKRRQVDAFLRSLDATLGDDELPRPLRVVDLGCGNAYLTFAAYRHLSTRDPDVTLVGVDVRADQRERNTELAARLGWADRVRFVAGTIREASTVDGADIVLALHACDTATDEALARAVEWRARWVLAAPCCHHDIAAQLRQQPTPDPWRLVTRYGILRERFADVLTDSLRAALLRRHGYRVDVVEFVDSAHTPRNLLLRAAYTGAPATVEQQAEYESLVGAWGVTPRLAQLLHD